MRGASWESTLGLAAGGPWGCQWGWMVTAVTKWSYDGEGERWPKGWPLLELQKLKIKKLTFPTTIPREYVGG